MNKKIVITKNKFEILEYWNSTQFEEREVIVFNCFGTKIILFADEVIQLYEYLMKHREQNEKDIL